MIWELPGDWWPETRFCRSLAIEFSKISPELENRALTIFKHVLGVPKTRGFDAVSATQNKLRKVLCDQQIPKFAQFTKESNRGSQC